MFHFCSTYGACLVIFLSLWDHIIIYLNVEAYCLSHNDLLPRSLLEYDVKYVLFTFCTQKCVEFNQLLIIIVVLYSKKKWNTTGVLTYSGYDIPES